MRLERESQQRQDEARIYGRPANAAPGLKLGKDLPKSVSHFKGSNEPVLHFCLNIILKTQTIFSLFSLCLSKTQRLQSAPKNNTTLQGP